ncbi:MAG: carboxypeptidase-like regulatory domain-containing protein [Terriglobia bacterium]
MLSHNRAIASPPSSGFHSSRRNAQCITLALLLCAVACSALLGVAKKKTISRTVSGVVLDASDNPIAGATVELSDKYTGKTVAIYTEENGSYQFADLNPNHDYEIQARSQNKSSEVRRLSSLDDRDKIVMNLRIPPLEK